MTTHFFQKAKPIWLRNHAETMNKSLYVSWPLKHTKNSPTHLTIAGCTTYKVYHNGQCILVGPIRCAHGFHQVQFLALDKYLNGNRENIISIEITSYNINGYSIIDQKPFLQAEITVGEETLFYTDEKESLHFFELPNRIQKTQKYSYQRPFIEAYTLTPDHANWHRNPPACAPANLQIVNYHYELIHTHVPDADIPIEPAQIKCLKGQIIPAEKEEWQNRSHNDIGEKIKGFPHEELELFISKDMAKWEPQLKETVELPATLLQHDAIQINFSQNFTGLFRNQVTVYQKTQLAISFDEIILDKNIDPHRLNCCNWLYYELEPGEYQIESFEPYTMQHACFQVLRGSLTIKEAALRKMQFHSPHHLAIKVSNQQINKVLQAAKETFLQNVVDILMDCPSRERAGWLCDSYFMGYAEYYFDRKNTITKNFLNNFLLPESFYNIPDGMIPMNYPADHYRQQYIPNWAMWFVIEIEKYTLRTNDNSIAHKAKEKLDKLFTYFSSYENQDHLLENLPGWIFIEWSMANKLTEGINIPTNMLYARAMEAYAKLYQDTNLLEKSQQIKKNIIQLSYDGEFFHDQILRENGELKVKPDCTEVCQYFAYFFDTITIEENKELWNKVLLLSEETKKRLHPKDVLPGFTLRMDLLGRFNELEIQKQEFTALYLPMAEATGTLWEMTANTASLNHGFNSYLLPIYLRDQVGLTITHQKLSWQPSTVLEDEGCIQLYENGLVELRWKKSKDQWQIKLKKPQDYTFELISEHKEKYLIEESNSHE